MPPRQLLKYPLFLILLIWREPWIQIGKLHKRLYEGDHVVQSKTSHREYEATQVQSARVQGYAGTITQAITHSLTDQIIQLSNSMTNEGSK